jgi:hypothetical protein
MTMKTVRLKLLLRIPAFETYEKVNKNHEVLLEV